MSWHIPRLCLLALRQLVPPEVGALKLSAVVERGLARPQVQVLSPDRVSMGFLWDSQERKVGKSIEIYDVFL